MTRAAQSSDHPDSRSGLQPARVVAGLKELHALTGDAQGAQRVAWTEPWSRAREWLRAQLEGLPVQISQDEAGNLWATLPGESGIELWIGGHLDSVPDGGWLDGCLNVLAALEVLRRLAGQGQPPVTVCLVDWADEEGRFGVSLFGSSAVAGHLDPRSLDGLTDRQGVPIAGALQDHGASLEAAPQAARRRERAAAYLELHIEQGPVLESLGLPLAAVTGTRGVERCALRFTGQAAHSGSTPMEMRRDALSAAALFSLEIREIARRHAGVGTVGRLVVQPGIPTAVAGQCDLTLDQRHLEAGSLAQMLAEAQEAARRIAAQEGVELDWKSLYRIAPEHFHPDLINLAEAAVASTGSPPHRMPSGPLHDAVEMSRAGIPTAMLFVQSLRGLSHTREEDTLPEHLELAVQALDRLVDRTIAWLTKRL